MDTRGDAASFDRDHLAELLLDAFGGAAAKVAFTTLGAHQNPRPGNAEAFRGRLMGLELIFRSCLLARHLIYSFSHKTP